MRAAVHHVCGQVKGKGWVKERRVNEGGRGVMNGDVSLSGVTGLW